MNYLILCEGKYDSAFIETLIRNTELSSFAPTIFPLTLQFEATITQEKTVTAKEYPREEFFDGPQITEQLKESTLAIYNCGGLQGIKDFVKILERFQNTRIMPLYYSQVPIMTIWDQDPGNNESTSIRNYIKNLSYFQNNCIQTFKIKPMLEGLIIQYLQDKLLNNGIESDSNGLNRHIPKAIQCMESYITCLNSQSESIHAKIRLNLLETGLLILSSEYNEARQNLDTEHKIIPQIFANIDFTHDYFGDLLVKLQSFFAPIVHK